MTCVHPLSKKILSIFLILSLFSTMTLVFKPQKADAATVKIDQYISNVVVSKLSDGRYKVTYTTLARPASSWESLKIGYEWPNLYRSALAPVYQEFDWNPGSHTMYFNKPASYISHLSFKIKYTAYSYSEEKYLTSSFNYATGTFVTTRTLTATDAMAVTAIYSIPGIYAEFNPVLKQIKWVGRALLGWTLASSLSDSAGYSLFPTPKAGNFEKFTSTYSPSGQITTKTEVWNTKYDYDTMRAPIYSSSNSWQIPIY